jgi:PAS domain S-box-containing protein
MKHAAHRRHVLAMGCLALAAPWAAGQAARTRLRYGGDARFAPFESLDASGRPQGFQIELLTELARVLDIDFEITLQPWQQTEKAFREGKLDLVAMVDTEARRSWAGFARGHATPALAVYRPTGKPETQGLHDLQGQRVAVLQGEAMRATLATWLAGLKGPFQGFPDAGQALAAVANGQVDVALLPRAFAEPLLASGAAPGIKGSHLNLALQTYALAAAPGQDALLMRLQSGLDRLEAEGTLETLRTRWLGSHRDVADKLRAERGLAVQQHWTWAVAATSTLGLGALAWGLWRRGQRLAAERRRRLVAESALQQAEELLQHTFAQHADAMMLVEPGSLRVLDANAAMLSLLGTEPAGLIGRPLAELKQHVDTASLEDLVRCMRDDEPLRAAPVQLRRADGQPRHCLVSADRLMLGAAAAVFCVVRDVTEQLAQDAALRAGYDAAVADLAQARTALEAAQQGQAQAEGELGAFTQAVAHDLKSPVFAIQGFAGLLRERLQAGQVQEALGISEQIARSARRMGSMITALAGLAQVSRQPLRRLSLDMGAIVQETWALLAASYPDRRAELRLSVLPAAQADPALAAQVWQNLLDNAAKYSARSERPLVAVDSYRDARGTWYRVADNGVGFDRTKAQGLFQPFQRMHAGNQFEGQGVGLSLVRRIVQHHGGEIHLRSAPGVGTVAEFTLDPAPAAA